MKSTTITILATVGVLALASVAMVVNADTLSSIGTGAIGGASEVLIPASTDTPARAVPTVAPTSSTRPTASHSPSGTAVPSSSDGDSSRNGGATEQEEHEEYEDGDDD